MTNRLLSLILVVQTLALAALVLERRGGDAHASSEKNEVVIADHRIGQFDPLPVRVIGKVDCD